MALCKNWIFERKIFNNIERNIKIEIRNTKEKTYFVTDETKEPRWDLLVSPGQDKEKSKEN